MKNPTMNPHGRTRLLGAGGEAIGNGPRDAPDEAGAPSGFPQVSDDPPAHVPRYKPKRYRPDVPLSHGHFSDEQVAALNAEGQRRAAGGDTRAQSPCSVCRRPTRYSPVCPTCRGNQARRNTSK